MSKFWIRMIFGLFLVIAPSALIGCSGEEPKPAPAPAPPTTPPPAEGGATPAAPAGQAK
jgi:hypothetical protein